MNRLHDDAEAGTSFRGSGASPQSAPRDQFEATWLRAREPVDHRSRSDALVSHLRAGLVPKSTVRVVDLGCGTGSNARYVAPRLTAVSGSQSWVFVDHDEDLLAHVEAPAVIQRVAQMHAGLDEFVSSRVAELGRLDLITASALLDLVSERWLRALIEVCRRGATPALFALTYDGDVTWVPADADPSEESGGSVRSGDAEDDAFVRDAVNRHQHRDKGLGAALGPAAGRVAGELFRAAGYHTRFVHTPWRLTAADAAVVEPLMDGWSAAAVACVPSADRRIGAWVSRRRRDIDEGRVVLTVGHVDLLALPGVDP